MIKLYLKAVVFLSLCITLVLRVEAIQTDGIQSLQFIEIELKSLELLEVDPFKMELKIQLVIEQNWDERKQNFTDLDFSKDNISMAQVNNSIFWSPPTSVQNARELTIVNSMWTINRNGRHFKIDTLSFTLGCRMSFSTYPFDHQRCQVEIGQQFLNVASLQYKLQRQISLNTYQTNNDPMDIENVEVFTSQFTLVRALAFVLNVTEIQGSSNSKVIITIHLRRHWSSYISSYFISMSSFVYISLLTLWLVYPKISVMVNFLNIILTNIFLVLHRNALDIPKVYYITAMNFYSTTCIIFIILVLLVTFELLVNVYVLYYIKCEEEDDEEKAKRRNAHDLNIRSETNTYHHSLCTSSATIQNSSNLNSIRELHDSPIGSRNLEEVSTWVLVRKKFLDRVRRNSHWTLLITFLFFNCIFWITMLSIHYLQ